jgi:S1-C subfamily serine protease
VEGLPSFRPAPEGGGGIVRSATLVLVVLLSLVGSTNVLVPAAYSQTVETVATATTPSVAAILVQKADGLHSGTGFMAADRRVVTTFHLVEGARRIQLKFPGVQSVDATVAKTDQANDVAVLSIPPLPVKPLALGTIAAAHAGETIVVIAYPRVNALGAESPSVVEGILSAIRPGLLRIQAPVSPDNDGAPALNLQGEVIGIVRSTPGAQQPGISVASTITAAKPLLGGAIVSAHPAPPLTSAQPSGSQTQASTTQPPAPPSLAPSVPLTLPQLLEKSKPAGVLVKTDTGCGSAFAVDAQNGLLVTALHVVRDAHEVTIQTAGGEQTAQVVAVDVQNDLALLQANVQLPTLKIAEHAQAGQDVIVIGYPLCLNLGPGADSTVTKGIVSGLNRLGPIGGMTVIQIDAAINPGNSGGPTIADDGTVIGVVDQTRQLATPGTIGQAINFAIPYDAVNALITKAQGQSLQPFSLPLLTTVEVPLSYSGGANGAGASEADAVCASPPTGAVGLVGVRGQLSGKEYLGVEVWLSFQTKNSARFGYLDHRISGQPDRLTVNEKGEAAPDEVCLTWRAQNLIRGTGIYALESLAKLTFEANYTLVYTVWASEVQTP